MRALLVVLALTAPAAADSKTKQLAKDYAKELAACKTRSDGVAKVTTGTKALVDDGQKQYQSDLDALDTGLAQVQAYCAELAATLELLAAPDATYKALEKQLDDHDNKIRKLRQASKKALDDLAPVIGKMIPAINARAGAAAAPVTKKVPIKFPSGRAIDAPALAGTWKVSGTDATDSVDYTEGKASSTVSVRLVTATCDQQRKSITAPSTVDATASDALKPLAWYVAYQKDMRRVRVGCRAIKGGALVATIDDPGGTWPELEPVMAAMLAARK